MCASCMLSRVNGVLNYCILCLTGIAEADVGCGGNLNGPLMAIFVRNIRTKIIKIW